MSTEGRGSRGWKEAGLVDGPGEGVAAVCVMGSLCEGLSRAVKD